MNGIDRKIESTYYKGHMIERKWYSFTSQTVPNDVWDYYDGDTFTTLFIYPSGFRELP